MSTPDDAPTTPKATAAKPATGNATAPKGTASKATVAMAGTLKAPKAPVEPKARPKAKAAPMEAAPPSAKSPTGTERPRGLLRIAAIAGVAVLGVATLYLLAMTVLWGVHHHALTGAQADLTKSIAAQQAIVDSQAQDLESAQVELTDALGSLSAYATQKATAQDYESLFRANDTGMLECANGRVEVVKEVKNRGIYITWTLHRYDDQVAAYCNEIVGYFNDNTAIEESL
jgi:hypothetical protein